MLYFRKIIKFELHIRTIKKIEGELIFIMKIALNRTIFEARLIPMFD